MSHDTQYKSSWTWYIYHLAWQKSAKAWYDIVSLDMTKVSHDIVNVHQNMTKLSMDVLIVCMNMFKFTLTL
jgi:hypothetical protein